MIRPIFAEWSDLVERSDEDRRESTRTERTRSAPTTAHSVPRPREWFAVYLFTGRGKS